MYLGSICLEKSPLPISSSHTEVSFNGPTIDLVSITVSTTEIMISTIPVPMEIAEILVALADRTPSCSAVVDSI